MVNLARYVPNERRAAGWFHAHPHRRGLRGCGVGLCALAALAGTSGLTRAASAQRVLAQDFENPAPGWTTGGQWQITSANPKMAQLSHRAGAGAAGRISDSLVSPVFALSGSGNIMTFASREQTTAAQDPGNIGSLPGRDLRLVEISVDAGQTWTLVASSQLPTSGEFTTVRIGLDGFGPAARAQLRFRFDSVSDARERTFSWAIDDVLLTRASVPIELTAVGPVKPPLGPLLTAADASTPLFAAVDQDQHLVIGEVAPDRTIALRVLAAPSPLSGRPAFVHTHATQQDRLVVAGTDGRIYQTARSGTQPFPAPVALAGVSASSSRIAADWTSIRPPGGAPSGALERMRLVWVGRDSHVYLAYIDLATPSAAVASDLTQRLGLQPAGAAEPALGANHVAIPSGPGVVIARLAGTGLVHVARLDAPLGASIAEYGELVHALYASPSGEPRDLLIAPTWSADAGIDVSAPGTARAQVTTRPELAVHRGQLFASWVAGHAPLLVRLDGADGEVARRWISEYSGRGVVASAPALATETVANAEQLVVYLTTSVGRAVRLHVGGAWEDLGQPRLGTEVLHPIDTPSAITRAGGSEGYYALDDGRLSRIATPGGVEILAAPETLYGAESGPAAIHLERDRVTVALYEAGSEIVQARISDATLQATTTRLALPPRVAACSPPSVVATAAGYRVLFVAFKHPAAAGALCSGEASVGMFVVEAGQTTYKSLGGLPGGKQLRSFPVAAQAREGSITVVVLGDNGRLYWRAAGGSAAFKAVASAQPVPALRGRLAVASSAHGVAIAALGDDRRLVLGRVEDGKLRSIQLSPVALRFQSGPAMIRSASGALHVFASGLDGHLYEGISSGGEYAFQDRGLPPTPGAPELTRSLGLLSVAGHLLGSRADGSGLAQIDLRAAGFRERLATAGFEVLWHPNHFYPQPETSLDQTEFWSEAAHVLDRLPGTLAARFMRDVSALSPFDHARSLLSPILQTPAPSIGARPYRNIVFGEATPENEKRQWEEFGHNMTVEIGIESDAPPNPAFADAAVRGEMKAIFAADASCYGQGPGRFGQTPDGQRWRGYVTYGGAYQCSSTGHAFIYPLYEYSSNGARFRRDAANDAAAGVDLLRRKYEWIRTNIYGGRDFNAQGQPCLAPPGSCR